MSERDRCLRELKLAGMYDKDADYDGMVGPAVEELLETFFKQGHSGFSASLVSSIFYQLIKGRTLTPLTGMPDEWVDVDDKLFQNRRCGSVFKEKDTGQFYDVDGYIFVNKNGSSFTCKESHKSVTFPYSPEPIRIVEGTPEAEGYAKVFERLNE